LHDLLIRNLAQDQLCLSESLGQLLSLLLARFGSAGFSRGLAEIEAELLDKILGIAGAAVYAWMFIYL